MSEERAQYGGCIDAGNIPITRIDATETQAILRDLRAENERLRKALRSVVHNLDGRTEPVHPLMVQSCVEEVKRALNHAAPSAEREGE